MKNTKTPCDEGGQRWNSGNVLLVFCFVFFLWQSLTLKTKLFVKRRTKSHVCLIFDTVSAFCSQNPFFWLLGCNACERQERTVSRCQIASQWVEGHLTSTPPCWNGRDPDSSSTTHWCAYSTAGGGNSSASADACTPKITAGRGEMSAYMSAYTRTYKLLAGGEALCFICGPYEKKKFVSVVA